VPNFDEVPARLGRKSREGSAYVGAEEGGVPRHFGERLGGDVLGHGVDPVDVRIAADGGPVRPEPLVRHAAHDKGVGVLELLHSQLRGFVVEGSPAFRRLDHSIERDEGGLDQLAHERCSRVQVGRTQPARRRIASSAARSGIVCPIVLQTAPTLTPRAGLRYP
jgi:hypothetical protein